jgi:hypothetical protein
MNRNGQTHPARSVDFLSRLHDGELDAGERARFEAHRAHCPECRRAVVEFEDAISLFRSTRSSPPRSDLAGRILRKVQSTNRPRTPFPRRFQIDLGWAGLLLTALFAVLITTQIVVRRNPAGPLPDASSPAPTPPIFVRLPSPVAAAPRESSEPALRERENLADTRRATPRRSREEYPTSGTIAAAPKAEARKTDGVQRSEPRDSGKPESRVEPAAPDAASAGGEGEESSRVPFARPTLRLSIREADGFGGPPSLLTPLPMALPPSERGREYLVLVDPQGIVRKVTPERGVSGMLSRMRFEAGPLPRRLIVRFE